MGHEPQKPGLAPPHSRRAPLTQVSDAHVVHSLLPVAFWKWPKAQLWHMPPFSKRPASHFVQALMPRSGPKWPRPQGWQLEESVFDLYIPSSQLTQVPGLSPPHAVCSEPGLHT